MRLLNEDFLEKFENEYKDLLNCIVNDADLDMQIRENYLNVYYKGGNILKIRPRSFDIDKMYFYIHTRGAKTSTEIKNDKASLSRLNEQRKQLLALLPEQPQEYFRQAKEIMDLWDRALSDKVQHNEKKEQQQIAIANRNNTDYIVLDLEYAVSRNSKFAYNGKAEKLVPRFDIVAIKDGILAVIELKKGLGALDNTSGIKPHMDCFLHTIGRDKNGLFIKEMQMLLKQKQRLGLLDKSLVILNNKPRFVFAFADEAGKDEFDKFVMICKNEKNKYYGPFIYLNSSHKLLDVMNRSFYYQEQREQTDKLKQFSAFLFDSASASKDKDFVLSSKDRLNNLYQGIREEAIEYFKKYHIDWWQFENASDVPSGHLVSSQIHCLNHLFALRTDADALKMILCANTCLQIEKILPSPLDEDGYITFEFAFNNIDLLGERGNTRGANCTSIDALVYAQLIDGKKILIPIEWKYTETYRGKEAKEDSLSRYPKRILPTSNLVGWNDFYKSDPYYEFMRQTLLVERIIANKENYELKADAYFHIVVVPQAHSVLRERINKYYIPTLKDKTIFKMVDQEELLAPLTGNEKYTYLIEYLKTRYWHG